MHPKAIIEVVYKVKRGMKMDRELETWIDEIMAEQQYRNGIFSKISILDRLRKSIFGSGPNSQ